MSDAPPIVSIIIDNYNYDRFLAAAIDSALAQTYQNCEVIVVDDGSTDKSRDILASYSQRITTLLQPNAGQAAAFNAGFARSSGDLILFLDSDDMLSPNAVVEAVRAWKEGAAKIQFPLEIIDSNGSHTGLLMPRAKLSSGDVLPDYLRCGRYVTPPTSGNLFSRLFLERIFPIPETEWRQTGDGYVNTAAPFFGIIISLDTPLGFYRYHGDSMSSVCTDGKLNLGQMEKLLRHAAMERGFLNRLAEERGLHISNRAVFGHWMHLKLRLSYDKLADIPTVRRLPLLLKNASEMARSLSTTSDLPLHRKLQHLIWTIFVVFLPRRIATRVITYAFETAPQSTFSIFLRRA